MRGFSLVELSIVLVILGLLTGGILAGQSLIRASELRAIASDAQQYYTSIVTFRDKYMALPGDMTKATSFWGTMTNCGVASPSGTGTQTCNGNGDGLIDLPSAASRTGENHALRQHLAAAGLVNGSYNGISGSGSAGDSDPGINVPSSSIGNSAGFSVRNMGTQSGALTYYFNGSYMNSIAFGRCDASECFEGVISPEEMWGIDTKIDDGKPGVGYVVTRPVHVSGHPNCVTGDNTQFATATYQLTSTNKAACGFYLRQRF